jgi:fructokinase
MTKPLRVALAGEALIDLIANQNGKLTPCLGGAVFNLARALSRQGVGSIYLNPLSSDRFGRQLAQQLLEDGVHLAQPIPIQEVTSLAVVNLTEKGHPDYAFYREGVADRAITSELLVNACRDVRSLELVCTGALALDPRDQQHYLPWLKSQKAAGHWVVVDANLRPSVMSDMTTYRNNILEALLLADIIKVSDEDLAHLQIPGNTPIECAQHLLRLSCAKLIALTLGANGAWLLTNSGVACFGQETVQMNIADTVGAGDSFLAGLLAALLIQKFDIAEQRAVQRLLRHAIASASLCVQEHGCVPPSWDQAQAWATQHPLII